MEFRYYQNQYVFNDQSNKDSFILVEAKMLDINMMEIH